MKHSSNEALLAGAIALEIKGDDDSPNDIVTKALADLTKTVDERLKAVETKSVKIKALTDRIDGLEVKIGRPKSDAADSDTAVAEKKAFNAYLRYANAAPADELKTLVVSSDPAGGYLAPTEMSAEFIRELTELSPVRSVASVRPTSNRSVTYPRRTAITNAKWKGETETREGSEPAFGQIEIPVDELTTFVDISNQLLADSAGEADAEVRLALAEDFAQKEAVSFLTGNGVNRPLGVLANTDIVEKVSGAATTISADNFIDVFYALPAAYRNAGTWAMNAQTLATVSKFKDGAGQYLWRAGLTADQPPTILGRPILDMPDMPNIGAGLIPIVFGDWSGYRIVDRTNMSILVDPYTLATNGLTRIHATRRVGGAVLQPSKFRKLKVAAA